MLAVEPSATMRAQRPRDAAPCLAGRAEALPFDDDVFDAPMACITIHHWEPPEAGLRELRRVTRGPVVVLTLDLDAQVAWQRELFAPALTIERTRFPHPETVAAALGGRTRIETIPTPADCTDGFQEAYWNRPEALLDPAVRASQSMWALISDDEEERIFAGLREALESGAWDREHGHLRELGELDGFLRLVVSEPEPA